MSPSLYGVSSSVGFTDERRASHTQGEAFTIGRHLPPKESCIPTAPAASLWALSSAARGDGRRSLRAYRQHAAAERHGVPIISTPAASIKAPRDSLSRRALRCHGTRCHREKHQTSTRGNPSRFRAPFLGRGCTCRKRAKVTNADHCINPIFAGLQSIFTGLVRSAYLGGFSSLFSALRTTKNLGRSRVRAERRQNSPPRPPESRRLNFELTFKINALKAPRFRRLI